MESIQITGMMEPRRTIQAIKLLRHFLSDTKDGGHLGLTEAKSLVYNFNLGIPFPKLYPKQALSFDFRAMFYYDIFEGVETPALKLFKVTAEADVPVSMEWEVIILSITEEDASVAVHKYLHAKHAIGIMVNSVHEVVKFTKDMILGSVAL